MGFFENKIDENAIGKNLESLKKSRQIRSKFIVKYGFVPESILLHNKSEKKAIDLLVNGDRSYEKSSSVYKSDKRNLLLFNASGRGSRGGALSRFPQKIGRLLVDFYCPEYGLIYDPFAGHNSRMQLAYECNRNYVGVDISKEFMDANRKIKKILLKQVKNGFVSCNKKNITLDLIECSSDKVDLPDDHADFTITSPPYWDIEYYGDELEQLGNAKTYENFLDLIFNHIKENYRILKFGSFCIWCVNDFRKNKIFYPYHSDLISLFEDVGFEIFNICIIDLGKGSIGSAFVQSILKSKTFPKRHEYILIFKKGMI